jgi:hypothetical protein
MLEDELGKEKESFSNITQEKEEVKRGSKQSRGSVLWDSDAISPL